MPHEPELDVAGRGCLRTITWIHDEALSLYHVTIPTERPFPCQSARLLGAKLSWKVCSPTAPSQFERQATATKARLRQRVSTITTPSWPSCVLALSPWKAEYRNAVLWEGCVLFTERPHAMLRNSYSLCLPQLRYRHNITSR